MRSGEENRKKYRASDVKIPDQKKRREGLNSF
jgi:hypothetical protein